MDLGDGPALVEVFGGPPLDRVTPPVPLRTDGGVPTVPGTQVSHPSVVTKGPHFAPRPPERFGRVTGGSFKEGKLFSKASDNPLVGVVRTGWDWGPSGPRRWWSQSLPVSPECRKALPFLRTPCTTGTPGTQTPSRYSVGRVVPRVDTTP